MNYTLIKNFVAKEALEPLIASCDRVIRNFYTPHHLQEHSAYLSDKSENRESYAFSVGNKNEGLPVITNELLAESSRSVALLNQKISEHLEVTRDARLLLNFQLYYGNSKPVPKHFDGEYFDFEAGTDGNLKLNHGLRPKYVAVLVLANDSDGGGTRLHYADGSSEVVIGQPGDLLVFSNATVHHSVDELCGSVKRPDKRLRMTMGWRALEESTQLVQYGQNVGEVSPEHARTLHKEFLRERWPMQYAELVKGGKLPAF